MLIFSAQGRLPQESELSTIETDVTIDYTYDALDRLKTATYSSGKSYAFIYDKVGNRTSQTVNSVTTSYLYDAANRLTSVNGVTYSWDANGNLLNDSVMSYSFNSAGRLAGITAPEVNYEFGL